METWLRRRSSTVPSVKHTEERNNDIFTAAASAVNVHTVLQHSSQPMPPPLPHTPSLPLFLLWFSVLTGSGLVLKSSPDSLMWLLSFGTLQESVSEPRECKNSLGVDRKYFKKLVQESDLHPKQSTFLSEKEGKSKKKKEALESSGFEFNRILIH